MAAPLTRAIRVVSAVAAEFKLSSPSFSDGGEYPLDNAPMQCPWVGHKRSGFGYHSGPDGWRQFSTPKSIVVLPGTDEGADEATPPTDGALAERQKLAALQKQLDEAEEQLKAARALVLALSAGAVLLALGARRLYSRACSL